MDLVDGIRVLVATVETGSFSAAGQRLGMSAKLASKYMAELEARLGARLLARTTRRIGLTPAGERLMARAPEWLDMLADMTGDIAEPAGGLTGMLRVTAPVTYGELFVVPQLRRFAAPHPGLSVDVRLTDRYVDLAADGVDLAIRIGALADSALVARRIGATSFLLVAAPDYFRVHGVPQNPDDLAQHQCIRDSNMRSDGAWPLHDNGAPQRVTPRGRFTVNSLTAARDLALAGEGIAYCPDYLVADALADGRLVALPAQFCGPPLPINAVHLPARQLARRTRALIDHLVQATPA